MTQSVDTKRRQVHGTIAGERTRKLQHDVLLHTNVENERAVLGALLIDPEQAAQWLEVLKAEHFYEPRHQTVLVAMQDTYARLKAVSGVLLDDTLMHEGMLAEVGQEFVHGLVNTCENPALASVYVQTLIENWAGRAQYFCGNDVLAMTMTRAEGIARLQEIGEMVEHVGLVAEGRTGRDSLEELMGEELAPVRWVVPGLIPEGVSVLASKRKLGKSWLVFALAIAVGAGGRWLGQSVEQGEALYLALEDSKRRLQDRGRKLLMGAPAPSGVFYELTWPLLSAGGLERLDGWLRAHSAARVVIIDVLARVKTAPAKWADPYLHDYSVVSGLKHLADRYHVGIVLTHHARKADATDVFDAVHGSTGLTAAADTLMVLSRARGEREAQLAVTGRDAEEATYALRFAPATGTWELLGDAAEVGVSREAQEVVRVLRASAPAPMSDQDICKALGATSEQDQAAVRQRLSRMVKRDEITSPRRGMFTVAPKETHVTSVTMSQRHDEQDNVTTTSDCDIVTDVTQVLNGHVPASPVSEPAPVLMPLPRAAPANCVFPEQHQRVGCWHDKRALGGWVCIAQSCEAALLAGKLN